MRTLSVLICCALLLVACEQLGIEDPAKVAAAAAAARDANGKAVGAACRQSGRALEDCYALNPKDQKSSIFAGWRDMDGYMRDNKIETTSPEMLPRPGASNRAPARPAGKS